MHDYSVRFNDLRKSVKLAIRKIMYAPSKQGEQPSVEVSKEFVMSPNKLHLEASLDKEVRDQVLRRGCARPKAPFGDPCGSSDV